MGAHQIPRITRITRLFLEHLNQAVRCSVRLSQHNNNLLATSLANHLSNNSSNRRGVCLDSQVNSSSQRVVCLANLRSSNRWVGFSVNPQDSNSPLVVSLVNLRDSSSNSQLVVFSDNLLDSNSSNHLEAFLVKLLDSSSNSRLGAFSVSHPNNNLSSSKMRLAEARFLETTAQRITLRPISHNKEVIYLEALVQTHSSSPSNRAQVYLGPHYRRNQRFLLEALVVDQYSATTNKISSSNSKGESSRSPKI